MPMLVGHVRDHLPRVILTLPSLDGIFAVEFIVDTGFDGDLALPSALVRQINASFSISRTVRLADGTERAVPFFEIILDWDEEPRLTEITVMENNPLLGALLLEGFDVHIEMADGGEVQIEPL